ncbi:tripartite tricarboxylate transporter substrate binding protein [Paralcaligenes ureilyticus]|uniref:Tripartite-type tricarboxylate transporter receptor subunit TctC n=1 Tax=Paralcaligenes ureilyticus TaxID=627131 RepID=A0A4V2UXU1_9BURK|nr:tripartite tricarboxylate transporter substrate binding protein [Paralcaligenes ureilyticus]TCT04788.1 tripartite-type tricarboxylate transporter receptor subunit TctC [Paralcaligenes ureilyticus]
MKNTWIARLLLVGVSLLLWSSPSLASYPDKPIHFICTSAAGSSLDLMMRTLAKFLGGELKQTVIVENRPGGTGAVGMGVATNAPADGYTVVSATGSTSFFMAEGKSSYTTNDFIFLRGLQAEPSAIAVRKDSKFHTLPQLVEALRKDPDKINIGGYAAAGFHQFVYYRLQQAARFEGVWVPFQGGNQAVMALMGGFLDAAVITPSSALPQLRHGDLRLLAISTPERDHYFPDVPTFKEQGYDVVEALWRGVMVKTGTPPDVIAVLSSAMDRVEANPAWKKFMTQNVQSPLNITGEEMQNYVIGEVAERRKFLQTIGAK